MNMIIRGTDQALRFERRSTQKKNSLRKSTSDPREDKPRDQADEHSKVVSLSEKNKRGDLFDLHKSIRLAEELQALASLASEGLGRARETVSTLIDRFDMCREKHPGGQSVENPPWIGELLKRLDGVADETRYGSKRLLDGTFGCTGATVGDGLYYVGASGQTRSSPPEGYEVRLEQEPRRTTLLGQIPLEKALASGPVDLILEEGGTRVRCHSDKGVSPQSSLDGLRRAIAQGGLPLNAELTSEGRLLVQHRMFGAGFGFRASSSIGGVLSQLPDRMQWIENGGDIAGTMNGEPACGCGQTLTGRNGNPTTEGLVVRYTGLPFTGKNALIKRRVRNAMENDMFVGRVTVACNALPITTGAGARGLQRLRLDSVRPADLGRARNTLSGMKCLADISTGSTAHITDSMKIARGALADIDDNISRLKVAFSDDFYHELSLLRVKAQNIDASSPDQLKLPMLRLAVSSLVGRIRSDARSALNAQMIPVRGAMHGLLGEDANQNVRLP